MDKIEKALARFSKKEKIKVRELLVRIQAKDFLRLDLKKLRGGEDLFRVRKGDLRIIFRLAKDGNIFILMIERRSEKTYREF